MKFAKKSWFSSVIFLTMIFVLILPGLERVSAQELYDFKWATQGNGDQYITPYGIAVDKNQNSYIAGKFKGTYYFGAAVLEDPAESNTFVAKSDSNGDWIYANRADAGAGGYNEARGIAVDSQRNSYITGYFIETVQFGNIQLTASGSSDIFVAKLDQQGNWIWARRAGGSGSDYGYGIAVDQQDNIYVTGSFNGTADFGEDTFTTDIYSNIFVAKLNSAGNWVWAYSAGGDGSNNAGLAVTVDNNDGIFVTGRYQGVTADFGSIVIDGEQLNYYGFVAGLNRDGKWIWVEPFNIVGGDSQAITTDQYGNCYIAGYFRFLQFDGQNYYCNAYTDVFVARFDAQGKWFIQSHTGGTKNQGMNTILGITVDLEGNAYVVGKHDGNIKFGDVTLEEPGGFLAQWDIVEGGWGWAKPAGKLSYAVAMDAQDKIYVTGQYKERAVFDGIVLENTQSEYAENVFVANAVNQNTPGGLLAGFPYFDFSKWSNEPVVSSDHHFKVRFNKPLNTTMLENADSQAIYVRTGNNEVVPVTLETIGTEQDTIQVVQSSQYIPGEVYYLYVDADKIFSSQGTGSKQLSETVVMKFTVIGSGN
ncbi:MAG: SBBP repeat-containing protein [Bacteroidales bacterium]|nr:SBBP repeat-containing protein [Bacteroidales bacterium]